MEYTIILLENKIKELKIIHSELTNWTAPENKRRILEYEKAIRILNQHTSSDNDKYLAITISQKQRLKRLISLLENTQSSIARDKAPIRAYKILNDLHRCNHKQFKTGQEVWIMYNNKPKAFNIELIQIGHNGKIKYFFSKVNMRLIISEENLFTIDNNNIFKTKKELITSLGL